MKDWVHVVRFTAGKDWNGVDDSWHTMGIHNMWFCWSQDWEMYVKECGVRCNRESYKSEGIVMQLR